MCNGILDNIDMLIDCVLEMVDVIVDKLIDNLPKLIDGGIRLIAALANGLIRAIPNLVSKIPQIISAIVKGLISGIPAIFDVGKNIVEGLWNGIKNMGSWVTGKVKGFFGNIVGGVKDFLAILLITTTCSPPGLTKAVLLMSAMFVTLYLLSAA